MTDFFVPTATQFKVIVKKPAPGKWETLPTHPREVYALIYDGGSLRVVVADHAGNLQVISEGNYEVAGAVPQKPRRWAKPGGRRVDLTE